MFARSVGDHRGLRRQRVADRQPRRPYPVAQARPRPDHRPARPAVGAVRHLRGHRHADHRPAGRPLRQRRRGPLCHAAPAGRARSDRAGTRPAASFGHLLGVRRVPRHARCRHERARGGRRARSSPSHPQRLPRGLEHRRRDRLPARDGRRAAGSFSSAALCCTGRAAHPGGLAFGPVAAPFVAFAIAGCAAIGVLARLDAADRALRRDGRDRADRGGCRGQLERHPALGLLRSASCWALVG